MCRLTCSMMPLVFLQVLEPFCPLSEQENVEAEEVEVSQPTSNTNMFITSKTEMTSTSLSSDSIHNDGLCNWSLAETDGVSASLTVAFPAVVDAASLPPLSHCTSASQPCAISVSPLSTGPPDPRSKTLSVVDDSFIPPPPQSDPLDSHPCVDVTITPHSEIMSNEPYCSPTKLITLPGTLQRNGASSLPVPNTMSDSLV